MTAQGQALVDSALAVGIAFLLALPLGWERERQSRSAGLRTYALLSVCVCGFLLLARKAMGDPSEEADVFFGVLTGMGFVGSGAIVRSAEGVDGMRTAVSLWVAGAIGAGVAYGAPLLSAALSLMSVASLWIGAVVSRSRGTR